jgi:hypothetical protein
MGANSNVISNKRVQVTIMALKPNQLQIITNRQQANVIIELAHKLAYCQLHAQII